MAAHNEPLGLPRGSVRAILTLLIALPVPALMVAAMLGYVPQMEAMAWYGPMVILVLKDYFGTRTVDTLSPAEEPGDVAVGDDDSYAIGERDA